MSTALRIDRIDKNYLINGGMDFFQRGGASGTVNLSTTPTYLAADRYKISYTGTVTGTPNTTRVTSTLSPARAKYAIQLTGQRNASTLLFTMEQRIEGIEARELAYTGSASFSVWVFTPITGCSVRLTLNTANAEDNFTAVTQLSQQTSSTTIAASTWTKITFSNLSISSAANTGLALVVDLQIPSGTDGSAQNHIMTQMMLNAGTTASDFARHGRDISGELISCQRYYHRPGFNTAIDTNAFTPFGWGMCINSVSARINVPLPVIMRVIPTFGSSSVGNLALDSSSAASITVTGISISNGGTITTQLSVGTAGGLAAGNATTLYRNGTTAGYIEFDAEL